MGNVRTVQCVRHSHTERDKGGTEVGVLADYEVCKYIRTENGCSADIFSIDIIIPVSYRLNTFYAHSFREWLKSEALSGNERERRTVFFLLGKGCSC